MSPTEVEACINEMTQAGDTYCKWDEWTLKGAMRAAYAVAARHVREATLTEVRDAMRAPCSCQVFPCECVGNRLEALIATPTPPTREPALPGPVVGGEEELGATQILALDIATFVKAHRSGAGAWLRNTLKHDLEVLERHIARTDEIYAYPYDFAYRLLGRVYRAAAEIHREMLRSTQNTQSSEGET